MAIDDYLYNHPKGEAHNPKEVIDEFLRSIKATSEVLELSTQVWIKKL